jgi:hypothetical protein
MTNKFDVKALRKKVLDTEDVIYDTFFVKEWDAELPIKTLTAPELKKLMKYKNDEIRMTILAILYGCKTREGEAVFTEQDLAVFENDKSFGPIAKLGSKILEISGLGKEAEKDAKNE